MIAQHIPEKITDIDDVKDLLDDAIGRLRADAMNLHDDTARACSEEAAETLNDLMDAYGSYRLDPDPAQVQATP